MGHSDVFIARFSVTYVLEAQTTITDVFGSGNLNNIYTSNGDQDSIRKYGEQQILSNFPCPFHLCDVLPRAFVARSKKASPGEGGRAERLTFTDSKHFSINRSVPKASALSTAGLQMAQVRSDAQTSLQKTSTNTQANQDCLGHVQTILTPSGRSETISG